MLLRGPAARRLFKQVGVGASASQKHLVGDFVDQQPIGFDVTLPISLPFTLERMRSGGRWERDICAEGTNHGFEVLGALAATGYPSEILPESTAKSDRLHTLRV